MPPLIHLETVSKQYSLASIAAVNSITLSIYPSEFVAIMGPSGCGKSTLLNIMGAIDTASQGKVIFKDQVLNLQTDKALTQLRQTQIGFIFQFFNLLPTLTVSENIALPLALSRQCEKQEIQRRVQAQLQQLGLTHRATYYPAQLSGGEMQRVAIARAIIHQPELILADEPTGNLDSENGREVLERLQAFCRENRQTVVMATHSNEAACYASRIVQMRDGQILSDKLNAPN